MVTEKSLSQALNTSIFGRPILFFDQIDSTNSEALRQINQGTVSHGVVLIAASQSAGRGSGSNTWISDQPDGLWLSLVLESPLQFNPIQFFSSIALVDMLRREYRVPAHVKWPNDVLVGTRKISGTLVESRVGPDGRTWYIVGVGVNVNQRIFPKAIRGRAISLSQVLGEELIPLEDVFSRFMASLERWYNNSCDAIDAWLGLTRMVGRVLVVTESGRERLVICEGMSSTGALILLNEDGTREELASYTRTDIDYSYAKEDIAAWGSVARSHASARHELLKPAPSASYHTPGDEVDFVNEKRLVPYLEELFVARDLAFRQEVEHICRTGESISQLVYIGAGYDEWFTRKFGRSLRVFEVNDRVTTAKKKALVESPYECVFLVADARNPESLLQALRDGDYVSGPPTIVVIRGLLHNNPNDVTVGLLRMLSSITGMSGYVLLDFQMDNPPPERATEAMKVSATQADSLPVGTWNSILDAVGFEIMKVVNLGYADPLGDLGRWRTNVRSTLVVLRWPASSTTPARP